MYVVVCAIGVCVYCLFGFAIITLFVPYFLHFGSARLYRMASWSKEKVGEFIDIYRSHECLWNMKSKAYNSRKLKEEAYEDLVRFVRTFDNLADRDYIAKKIHNLRGCFRREWAKVNGQTSTEPYEPKLWYYQDLLFLTGQETGQRTTLMSEQHNENSDEDFADEEEKDAKNMTPMSSSNFGHPATSASPLGLRGVKRKETTVSPRPFRSKFIPKRKHIIEGFSTQAKRSPTSPRSEPSHVRTEDQFDSFGKTIAQKLRSLPREQRIFAEKIMNDTLFEAELGTLSRESSLVVVAQNYSNACQEYKAAAWTPAVTNGNAVPTSAPFTMQSCHS